MRSDHALSEETDRIQQLLTNIETVAIVGISRNQHKDSQYVGRYLKNAGYKIIPVNPNGEEILGETVYQDLQSIPEKVDAVNVFLPPEWIPEVVNQSIPLQPDIIWLQLGTGQHPDQVKKAKEKNIIMIENRCMKVDHQFLVRDQQE